MTVYNKIPLDLTAKQYESLAKGISTLAPLTLRLTQSQIRKGGGDLMLTGRQETHLDKSVAKGKGANITLSATQLKKMKTAHKKGGYLSDMTKCVAGAGMFGVDDAPEMPREAGVGAEAQDGAGAKTRAVVKVVKPIVKGALKEVCKIGAKALAVKGGIDITNPIFNVAGNEACNAAVNTLLGSGAKSKAVVKGKILKRTKRPNLEKY